MSSHIKLMGVLLNVIIGVALLVYIHHQRKRHPDRVLRRLMFYSSAVVAAILLFYLTIYLRLNIRPPMIHQPILLPSAILFLIIYILIISLSFSIISICYLLAQKPIPAWQKILAGTLVLITMLGFIAFVLAPPASRIKSYAYFLLENFAVVFMLAELIFLIRLCIFSRTPREGEDQRAPRYFALLFLSRYLIIPPVVFLLPSLIRSFVFMVVFQGVCFAWIRWFYLPHKDHLAWKRDSLRLTAELADRHGLTAREREILQLMLLGKNNREIEDQLFISYNTVKNHIHTLYGKIGISNRFQLFRLLRHTPAGESDDSTAETATPI